MSPPEVLCPACSSRLNLPAALRGGDWFACPKCALRFCVGIAAGQIKDQQPALPVAEVMQASADEIYVDLEVIAEGKARPRKRKMKESQRMKLAYWGLGLQYAKFLCVITNLVLSGLSAIIVRASAPDFHGAALFCLSVPLSICTPLIGLTGALLCFWVPKRSQARLLIQISFGLDAGAVLAQSLGAILILMGGRLAMASLSLTGMGTYAYLGACILFLLFLRALAFYLRDKGSESEVIDIMVRWIVMTVLAPLAFTPLGAMWVERGQSVFGMFWRLTLIGMLALAYLVFYFKVLIRLLNLIAAIRQKIASCYDFD